MNNINHKHISSCLRKCRKARGLEQKEVAQILKLKNTSMISRWEKGVCMPSTVNVFRLAVIYRTIADALFVDQVRHLRCELKKREDEVLGKQK